MDATVLQIQTYGELPMSFPEKLRDRVAHAILKVGETELMFSDSPGLPVQSGNQLAISITTHDVQATKQIYEALQEDGEVIAPLEETPFSPAFGSVRDKFGISFTIVTR